MPRDRLHRICVTFQGVELGLEVPEIPQANSLVCGTGSQDRLCCRIEGDGINSIAVLALRRCSRTSRVSRANIKDLESNIIGDSSDER